jgi:hypothetical protein
MVKAAPPIGHYEHQPRLHLIVPVPPARAELSCVPCVPRGACFTWSAGLGMHRTWNIEPAGIVANNSSPLPRRRGSR